MPRRIAVVSSSRSDYGFIKPVLQQISNRPALELNLIVTGSHLSAESGNTITEVLADNFEIRAQVDVGGAVTSAAQMAEAVGKCTCAFARMFAADQPDILVVIADRYEMFGVAVAGVASGLTVAHISGGDLTEGVIDDSFRHALTKLCHLHFPSNEVSARRILQMGEEPWRVHVVGEPSLDALVGLDYLSDQDMANRVGVDLSDWQPPLLVTLHPVNPGPEKIAAQLTNLEEVLDRYSGLVIITAANADAGGHSINHELHSYAQRRPKTRFVNSMGWTGYASLMRCARSMLGNSSSGLLEAPSFDLPVVNIGNRQRGRLRANNVIDVDDNPEAIWKGLQQALSNEFQASLKGMVNPYGDGHAAEKIVDVLEGVELENGIHIKSFQQWT